MSRILHRINRHRSTILMGIITAGIYLLLTICFFGLMGINNPQMLRASRTAGTVLLTWCVMLGLSNTIYGGFDVGHKKNKPVISSMCLGACVTDLVAYVQLQIMNVNEHNNATLELLGGDLPYLLLTILMQAVCVVIFVRLGNRTYFSLNPPKRCLLVLGQDDDEQEVMHKILRYQLQWRVDRITRAEDPDIITKIWASECVFLSGVTAQQQMELLHLCYNMQKDVICRAQLEDIMLANARQVIVDDAPFMAMDFHHMTLFQRIVKRVGDIGCSLIVLIVLSPLYLLISLAIFLEDGAPVIFHQKRMTVNGRVFTICKFRTMTRAASNAESQFSAQQGDQRITRVGAFLRRTRLDELPQFWNILRGDMTLVGPRPEMLENISRYKAQLPAFAYREKMKAGLTGFAQIEGRYNTTPEDKLMMDLMYIESFSIWLDIKLIFRTLTVFFKSDSTQGFSGDSGKSAEGNTTENKDNGGNT